MSDVGESRALPLVVLLHGFMGRAADLEPFARSLGVGGQFVFPEGRVDLTEHGLRGRAWWPVDGDTRTEALSRGPRDLSEFAPQELDEARTELDQFLIGSSSSGQSALVLGGFSQGAMLACDWAVKTPHRPLRGLVLFSGARISASTWRPLYDGRRGLRVFISHGRQDADLSFHAAESFQAELAAAGWEVTWCPFDGGHEIPLLVWRSFKRWLTALSEASSGAES